MKLLKRVKVIVKTRAEAGASVGFGHGPTPIQKIFGFFKSWKNGNPCLNADPTPATKTFCVSGVGIQTGKRSELKCVWIAGVGPC